MKLFFKTFDAKDAKMLGRVVIFLIAWINQILLVNGKQVINIDNDTVYMIISQATTLGTSVYLLWKNNDFTARARGVKKDDEN